MLKYEYNWWSYELGYHKVWGKNKYTRFLGALNDGDYGIFKYSRNRDHFKLEIKEC